MDRLDAMHAFVRVVESGSFSAVARELRSTQGAVSKQVAALERHLGVRLLTRSTRALSLTDEGRTFLDVARRIVADTREAESQLRAGQHAVTGLLRVGASVGYGRMVLFDIVRAFMAAHPGVRVDVHLDDRFVDPVGLGLDVAVRIGELADSALVSQRVGTTQRAVVASRAYVDGLPGRLALPVEPADLVMHDCVLYSGLQAQNLWEFEREGVPVAVRVEGRLATNSSELVHDAVCAGMGIGFSPTWLFTRELASGEVVRLLPGYEPKALPIHAVYPASRRHTGKVVAFVDFLKERLARTETSTRRRPAGP